MRYLFVRLGGVLAGSRPVEVATKEQMAEQVSERFPALPSALYEVRRFIRREAESSGLSPAMVNDLILAVSEASVAELKPIVGLQAAEQIHGYFHPREPSEEEAVENADPRTEEI